MTESDFEVMPRGTMVEIKEMRRFADEIINISLKYELPEELSNKIEEMRIFYNWHSQSEPIHL